MAQIPPIQITLTPTPKQHEAWLILHDDVVRELVFGGGAGGGKSVLGCMWVGAKAFQYPETRWLIGRKEGKRLKQTTLKTLYWLFNRWGVIKDRHYTQNMQDGVITTYNGSEIYLYDLDYQPSDEDYERLGSLELTGAFIDEAGEVRYKAIEVLSTRVGRQMNKEYNLPPKLLMSCNPTKNWLYTQYYRPWKKGDLPPRKRFLQSLHGDNEHLPEFYVENLANLTDKNLLERLYRGNWEYDDADNAIFEYDALTDMFTNDLPTGDDKYITIDVARQGKDKTTVFIWDGWVNTKRYEYAKNKIDNDFITLLDGIRRANGVPLSHTIADEDGVGGGLVDLFKCKGFVANSTPVDDRRKSETRQTEYKVNYQNLRAQCWDYLGSKVNAREIAILDATPDIQDAIIEECEMVKRVDTDKIGKYKVTAKDEIKQDLGRSPDYGDAIMMRAWFDLKRERRVRAFTSNPLG